MPVIGIADFLLVSPLFLKTSVLSQAIFMVKSSHGNCCRSNHLRHFYINQAATRPSEQAHGTRLALLLRLQRADSLWAVYLGRCPRLCTAALSARVAYAKMRKSLYTRLYIYAKREAVMYKYTAITALFRGVNSGKIQQTRTIFRGIGAVSEHQNGGESNSTLQNWGF